MKKAIGVLHNPDNGAEPLTIYYNGASQPMTAENAEVCEEMEYCPKDEADAMDAAQLMYSVWPWEYEEL